MKPPLTTVTATAVASLVLGFAAGSVPNNSVGSPQIKNGQVTAADLKNGGVAANDVADGSLRADDFAPGALPSAVTVQGTRSGFGDCGASGWCYLTSAGTGTTISYFDAAPSGSVGWVSSGPFQLARPSRVRFRADPVIWFFGGSNIDVVCSVKDGSTTLLTSGWVRSDGNQALVLTQSGTVELSAGYHLITLNCRSNGVEVAAVQSSTLSAVVMPDS